MSNQFIFALLFTGATAIAHNEFSDRNSSRNSVQPSPTETRTEEITDQTKGEHFNIFLAIGCAVASAFAVLFIVVFLVFRYKRRHKKLLSLKTNINQPPCKPQYTPVPVQPHLKPNKYAIAELEEEPDTISGYSAPDSLMNGVQVPGLEPEELHRKTVSVGPDGDTICIDDVTLRIWPGCLAATTEISFIKHNHFAAFKSLLDLGLVETQPQVIEFRPDGLKFLKPADLTIRFERTTPGSKMFLLHGSHNDDNRNVVWELVTNEIEENTAENVVNAKISGFSFYCYFSAVSDMIGRILSHVSHSFPCYAYAYYRRRPPMDKIDISVVLVSSFIDKNKEKIKLLKDHEEEGYIKFDKGMEKCLCTDQLLEMCLADFPGLQSGAYQFKVNRWQLDKDGFAIDQFKGCSINYPASGNVNISEVYPCEELHSLWTLNIFEDEHECRATEVVVQSAEPVSELQVQSAEPGPEPRVIRRTTRLSNDEINRLSNVVGVEWDSLAGLMNISYSRREEIRSNNTSYPNSALKAEKILRFYNDEGDFSRDNLAEHFDELGRNDWKNEIRLPGNEKHEIKEVETPSSVSVSEHNGSGEVETPPSPPEINANESITPQTETRLSSREMFRLSKRISADWDRLAGEMNIPAEERDDIRYNVIYANNRSKAEKILSIFNNRKDFSRKKLTDLLKIVGKLHLISPVLNGEWTRPTSVRDSDEIDENTGGTL